jgi:hypothetical protein
MGTSNSDFLGTMVLQKVGSGTYSETLGFTARNEDTVSDDGKIDYFSG